MDNQWENIPILHSFLDAEAAEALVCCESELSAPLCWFALYQRRQKEGLMTIKADTNSARLAGLVLDAKGDARSQSQQ